MLPPSRTQCRADFLYAYCNRDGTPAAIRARRPRPLSSSALVFEDPATTVSPFRSPSPHFFPPEIRSRWQGRLASAMSAPSLMLVTLNLVLRGTLGSSVSSNRRSSSHHKPTPPHPHPHFLYPSEIPLLSISSLQKRRKRVASLACGVRSLAFTPSGPPPLPPKPRFLGYPLPRPPSSPERGLLSSQSKKSEPPTSPRHIDLVC